MWLRAAVALLCGAAAAWAQPPRPPRPGIEFQGADLRALQADEFANPGMLWVARGEALWNEPRGAAGASCASCHGDARRSMRGVAATYPRHAADLGRVVNLEGRVLGCLAKHHRAVPWAWESEPLLSMTAYLAHLSRGHAISAPPQAALRPLRERGRRLYFERQGQLHLACHQCHDARWGRVLLAEKISQGHPADWPAYRMEWQALGSLQRRLRACFFGVRAALPAFGSEDLLALEAYLAERAQGVVTSPPGVRR